MVHSRAVNDNVLKMGSCFSSESAGDAEQKKRSQAIDRKLEEDSRRLRRECKILLLGRPLLSLALAASSSQQASQYLELTKILHDRVWRKW